ncbi:hypothetical protein [Domibacillus iocasae]|uniref:Uncharacterized protein n=1 Tax=Domibacillus iocasae TaxID=1714016 RepID=A0A1E7DMH2_9BACI|nr:hypothetical protein [Domibacillus iocasae]OES44205.1 hypothetical protein BA724_07895 [Domibacillus iocasae]
MIPKKRYKSLYIRLTAILDSGEPIYYRMDRNGSITEFPADKYADPLFANRFMKRDNYDFIVREYALKDGELQQRGMLSVETIEEIIDLRIKRDYTYESLKEGTIDHYGKFMTMQFLRKLRQKCPARN